jgi:hypothetical protein
VLQARSPVCLLGLCRNREAHSNGVAGVAADTSGGSTGRLDLAILSSGSLTSLQRVRVADLSGMAYRLWFARPWWDVAALVMLGSLAGLLEFSGGDGSILLWPGANPAIANATIWCLGGLSACMLAAAAFLQRRLKRPLRGFPCGLGAHLQSRTRRLVTLSALQVGTGFAAALANPVLFTAPFAVIASLALVRSAHLAWRVGGLRLP